MKKIITLILLCITISAGTTSWAGQSKQQTVYIETSNKSASFGNLGTRKMWIKGDKMRWESSLRTDKKPNGIPLCLIKNKQGVFLIHPWKKIAAQYPDGANRSNPAALLPGPSGPPRQFLESVKAIKGKQQTVEHQVCDVYDYTEPASKANCRLWMGVKSGKPVQLLIKGRKGKSDTVTTVYTKFEIGAKINNSLFELPKGYAIRPMPVQRLMSKHTTEKMKHKEPS